MKWRFHALLAVCLASASAWAETNWLRSVHWDDGLAEVSLYEGVERRYGELRPTEMDLITVREFMDPLRRVKTSPSPDKITLPVLKQNLIRRTRTGVYVYTQMGSVFLDRRDGSLVKLSAVSSEWCGNSSANVQRETDGSLQVDIQNYFDDQGRQSQRVPATPVPRIAYDALIPRLRQNPQTAGESGAVRLIGSLLTANPVWEEHESVIAKPEPIRFTWDGVERDALRIPVDFPWGRETFVFESEMPRRLFRWDGTDGSWLLLRKTMRIDYWNRNQPGDETLLQ
jgi:hypothetical protein